jgi:hypothetical protein
MIRQIAPQFFTTNLEGTLAYYKDKLGFECLGTWQDPPVYAIVARDQHAIHFRCAEPPTANPTNMMTNFWTRTSLLTMQMRFMRSMRARAWSSLGSLTICHGGRESLS